MKTTTLDLAATRLRIPQSKAELRALQSPARDQAQARTDNETTVAQMAAPITQRLRYAVHSGEMSDLFVIRPNANGFVDVGPLLAALFGAEFLAAALNRYADELPTATDHARRAARLAEVAAELQELERLEEAEIRRLEAQGVQIDRRADADPRVVLAPSN